MIIILFFILFLFFLRVLFCGRKERGKDRIVKRREEKVTSISESQKFMDAAVRPNYYN